MVQSFAFLIYFMHILLTGGGSGGHLMPLIAVARALKNLAEQEGIQLRMSYMGPPNFGRSFLELENIRIVGIHAPKWRRYVSGKNILDLLKIPLAMAEAFWNLFWIMPDVIFSKGGYGSMPALAASRFYRIPVMLHESDSVPGLANRYAAKFAKRIFTSFPHTEKYFFGKPVLPAGNPVRATLARCTVEQGRSILNVRYAKPVLFITGGSQGAQRINDVVINTLPHLLERYEVVHQCGSASLEEIQSITQKEYKAELLQSYHVFGLLNEEQMSAAYAVSDLVVSRAGASNIFEIAQAGKPSVIIPIQNSANNHQTENAHAYAAAGACAVLDEQNLSQNLFLEIISGITGDRERMHAMSQAARAFAKPDAADAIAQEIFAFVKRR